MKQITDLPFAMISNIAAANNLDPHLVSAIVWQESRGNEFAMRFEPLWKYYLTPEIFAQPLGISAMTEKTLQAFSYGLLQIMGSCAREHGFVGPLVQLCEPDVGLQYGCKQLAKFAAKYPNMNDQIAAYNAGSPRRSTAGIYDNQGYVDSVLGYFQLLQS